MQETNARGKGRPGQRSLRLVIANRECCAVARRRRWLLAWDGCHVSLHFYMTALNVENMLLSAPITFQ